MIFLIFLVWCCQEKKIQIQFLKTSLKSFSFKTSTRMIDCRVDLVSRTNVHFLVFHLTLADAVISFITMPMETIWRVVIEVILLLYTTFLPAAFPDFHLICPSQLSQPQPLLLLDTSIDLAKYLPPMNRSKYWSQQPFHPLPAQK